MTTLPQLICHNSYAVCHHEYAVCHNEYAVVDMPELGHPKGGLLIEAKLRTATKTYPHASTSHTRTACTNGRTNASALGTHARVRRPRHGAALRGTARRSTARHRTSRHITALHRIASERSDIDDALYRLYTALYRHHHGTASHRISSLCTALHRPAPHGTALHRQRTSWASAWPMRVCACTARNCTVHGASLCHNYIGHNSIAHNYVAHKPM